MKQILRGVLIVLGVLLASAARADAFSVGSDLSRNSPIAPSAGCVGGRIVSQRTEIFMADSAGVTGNDAALVDEPPKTDDPVDYVTQEGSTEMDVNAIFSTGVIAVVSLAVLTQLASAGGWSLQETAIHTSTNIWNSYSEILSTSPVQTKAVTSATVYTIGDIISQRTEGASMSELDGPRIGRSLLAGLLGHGPLSHVWYGVSENLFQNILHLPNDIFGTAAKVVIDQTTWGPFWNNTYILLLGLMKLNSFETIFSEMKRTTIPLIVSGLKLWPLAHCVTYGLVPVENRLLWVDVVEIAWVTILATTAAAGGKSDAGKEKQPNTQ